MGRVREGLWAGYDAAGRPRASLGSLQGRGTAAPRVLAPGTAPRRPAATFGAGLCTANVAEDGVLKPRSRNVSYLPSRAGYDPG